MHGRDQGAELIWRDQISPNKRGDDFRCEFGPLLIGHRLVPLFPASNNIPTPVNSGRQMRTPHIGVGPTTPSWDRPALGEGPTRLSLNGSHSREVETPAIVDFDYRMVPGAVGFWGRRYQRRHRASASLQASASARWQGGPSNPEC